MGPFGYGNLGDAAIQQAMIEHIRQRFPAAQIYGFSLNPADTEQRHGIRSFPISRQSWLHDDTRRVGIWRSLARWLHTHPNPTLRKLGRWSIRAPIEFGLMAQAFRDVGPLDILIISGGGQLDDYWAGGGPWSQPYTLLKWGLLARLRGAKFLVVSVGAGPVDAWLSRVFIRWALRLAHYRSYRDSYSQRYVAEVIGFRNSDPVYPDLAHSLPIERSGSAPRRADGRRVVAIGPIGYFRRECWPERDDAVYADYLAKLASFIAWLVEQQCAIVFVPGEVHYDQLVIDDLQVALRLRLPNFDQVIIPAAFDSPNALLAQLGQADLLIGSRFHNILLGLQLGKPAIALSYQAKIDALMADVGLADYCLPIGSFDEAALRERFSALCAEAAQRSAVINQRTAQYRAALEQQYERIFKHI